MDERIVRMERRWELREREERKNNIIVKGLKERGEGMDREIKELIKEMGLEAKVEEVRRLEVGRKELGGMAVVRLGSNEEKRMVMENKRKLRGGGHLD